ncbi:hypothetical protein CSC70_02360 [Pseudoxanthomonas kalamensis DSM 18571]|uniref:sensor histidine kinase n=1 Tax=Pseudoxanthomonas kalamensis TaxID=289483 RepID=UPI00139158CC|nr:HAMP domain-containing sensor histidine kinase [Pseudoxanthomonas kalamensis]KAF1712386.1 hypothetical protein CSC70_02360 [Pseudoxanthomonas kalamensis DSM 18571]
MSPASGRVRSARPVAAPPRTAPVVVSMRSDGELLDVVGDLDRFVAGGDGRQDVIERLQDLRRVDAGGSPQLIPSVELSEGRFADIHVLLESDEYHFVLQDTTELMQLLRSNQQVGNETALVEDRQRRRMRRETGAERPVAESMQAFRRSSDLFATLAHEMRAPLALLGGHVRLLEQRCRNDAGMMRSVAAIGHAAVRLDAMAFNSLVSLGEMSAGPRDLGVLELSQLAALLQEAFALQAQVQGIGLRIRLPDEDTRVEINDMALRQVMINLLIHALDGIQGGELVVSFVAGGDGLEIEIAHEPMGFSADHFGALVTTHDLLQSNPGASLGLAVSQRLLQQMRAQVELVPRVKGGHEIWVRIPAKVAQGKQPMRLREQRPYPELLNGEKVAVVAVEPVETAATLVELLVDLDVPVVSVYEADRLEALARDGVVASLALSSTFDGMVGREILQRLQLPAQTQVLLLGELPSAAGGWLQDHRGAFVAADADRVTLDHALRSVLGQ